MNHETHFTINTVCSVTTIYIITLLQYALETFFGCVQVLS